MREQSRTIRIAIIAVATLLLALFVSGAWIYLRQSRGRNELLMEFALSRAASLLTEAYLRDAELSAERLPPGVLGFGVYEPSGAGVLTLGTAPEALALGRLGGEAIEGSGDRLTLLREVGGFESLGPPESMMHRMPDRRSRMMRPGGMMGSGISRRPLPGAGPALLSYTEYDVSAFRGRGTQLALFVGLALGTSILLFLLLLYLSMRLRRSEQTLMRNRKLAELGEASRTLAHEIRNPLSALRSEAALLARSLPESQQESVEILKEEISRIAYLVERVGAFLRDPKGRTEKLDLAAFLAGLTLDPATVVETENGELPVSVDPEKLRSIIENLVANGVEATQAAGKREPVIIRLGRRAGFARIEVIDAGDGIAPGFEERIYDPFFTTKDRGSGVGLAITRRFVEAAGGTIGVQKAPGGGSRFVVELPIDE